MQSHIKTLCLTMVLVGAVIFDDSIATYMPEAIHWRSGILSAMVDEKFSMWRAAFEFQLFEMAPRTTRPLSSFIDILDVSVRSAAWQFGAAPHPSISISTLFFLPVFIFGAYLLFRSAFSCSKVFASVLTLLCVTQASTLSVAVLGFRAGKTTAVALLPFFLWTLWRWSERGRMIDLLITSLFGVVLISLDETAVLFALFCMFWIRYDDKAKLIRLAQYQIFAVAMALLLWTYVFPELSLFFGYRSLALGEYEALHQLNLFEALNPNLVFENFRLVVEWALGVPRHFDVFLPVNLIIISIGASLLLIFQSRIWLGDPKWNFKIHTIQAALVWIMLLTAHHLLLQMTGDGRVWAPFWYGAYLGLANVILLARFMSHARVKTFAGLLAALILFGNLNLLAGASRAYFVFHYYPYHPAQITRFFTGDEEAIALVHNAKWKKALSQEVLKCDRHNFPALVNKHEYWVLVERGCLTQFGIVGPYQLLNKFAPFTTYPVPIR